MQVPSTGTIGGAPYEIVGHEMQAVVVHLSAAQSVLAEPGAMLYMHGDVTMNTGTGGGFMAGLKRSLAGNSFFLSSFSAATHGEVCFAAPYPGTIHPVSLQSGEWLCQRHSFLCCSPEVTVTVALTQRLGYGMFGGEGFILQKLSGAGEALLHAGGHFIRRDLAPGEQLRVDAGTVVAFQSSVGYDIQMVPGFKNVLFGGEGLFFVLLQGPGTVILQTLSFDRLVSRIMAQAQFQQDKTGAEVAGLGALGGIVGGILGQ